MSCDVGKAMEELDNELWRRWSDGKIGEWAELIDIERYSRAHSPIFPSLHLRHNLLSNPSVALHMSQLILQPFRCLTYVTVHFSNSSFASPTSQVLHLIHLASRPCFRHLEVKTMKLYRGLPMAARHAWGLNSDILKIIYRGAFEITAFETGLHSWAQKKLALCCV